MYRMQPSEFWGLTGSDFLLYVNDLTETLTDPEAPDDET